MTTSNEYGYGHTKEAAAIVRAELKKALATEVKELGLKISVRKSDGGYGGPSVDITSTDENFADYYEYLVDKDGNVSYQGQLRRTKTTDKSLQWHSSFRVRRASEHSRLAKEVNGKINRVLRRYGRDNDDAMTDYFDNTSPLFYGVEYKEA